MNPNLMSLLSFLRPRQQAPTGMNPYRMMRQPFNQFNPYRRAPQAMPDRMQYAARGPQMRRPLQYVGASPFFPQDDDGNFIRPEQFRQQIQQNLQGGM